MQIREIGQLVVQPLVVLALRIVRESQRFYLPLQVTEFRLVPIDGLLHHIDLHRQLMIVVRHLERLPSGKETKDREAIYHGVLLR